VKKLLFLFLFISLLTASIADAATVYYVDNTITDTYVASATPDFTTYNPVTFETTGGSDKVYKNIADINVCTFVGDDQILFRRGQTFTNELKPPSSGTSGHQITFGMFGSSTSEKPIIWAIYGNDKNYITFQDLIVYGLFLVDGDYNVVDRCKNDGNYSINFYTTYRALDIDIALSSGTCLWSFGDGTTSTSADPGSKDFGSDTTRYHSLVVSDWTKASNLNASATIGLYFNIGSLPSGLTGSVHLDVETGLTGDIGSLPSGLTGTVYLDSATALTGNIGSLPSGLTESVIIDAATALTGNIGSLPSGLTESLYLNAATALTYTSVSWPMATGNSQSLRFDKATLNNEQAQTDDLLCDANAKGNTGCILNIAAAPAPSSAGQTCKTSLIAKGWTVTTK